MGWRLSGRSAAQEARDAIAATPAADDRLALPRRATVVPYGPDAVATARAANRILEFWGAYAYLWEDVDGPVVCCVRRGHARADAEFLLPGRQLVVEAEGGWRIEAVKS